MGKDQHDTPAVRYSYDEAFYRYIQQGAARSAQVIVPLLIHHLNIQSVLDVGCGAGAWLGEYDRLGIPTFTGVDGSYVKPDSLLISPSNFRPLDISEPFDLGRRYDLVQCLEVGEHIESSKSETLIANLVKHGDLVFFSAAVPGQGGENHINEQPYEFWRAIFAQHGYSPYDFFRPLLRGEKKVEGWYRRNVILYAATHARNRLSGEIINSQVAVGQPIENVSGALYKARARLFALLPVGWLSLIAVLKHRSVLFVRAVARRDSSGA